MVILLAVGPVVLGTLMSKMPFLRLALTRS